MATFNVKYVFQLVDRFTKRAKQIGATAVQTTDRINKMGAAFLAMEKRVNRLARGMRSLRTIGRSIASGGLLSGLGGTFVLHDLIRTNFQFSDVMNEVIANMQASDKVFRPALEKMTSQVAANTKFTRMQVVQMMLELARMGNSAERILSLMPVSADFATATGLNPQRSIDVLTNIAQAFGYQESELRKVADLFTKAFTNSPQTFHDIGEAFKFVTAAGTNFGVELREINAMLMVLARNQQKGSLAGTSLARVMDALLKSSGPAAKALAEIGITKEQFLDPATGKLNARFIEMLKAFKRAEAQYGGLAVKQAIARTFGDRGSRSFRLLYQRIDEIEAAYELLGDAGDATARASQERMQGLAGALLRLAAAWNDLKIAIGKAQMNADIIAISDAIRDLIGRFKELDSATKSRISRLVLGLGALAAFAIPIGLLIFALGMILSPLGLLITGIVALGAVVAYYWDDIVGFFENLGEKISADWDATVEQYKGYWDSFISFLESIPDRLRGLGQAIANALASIVPTASGWDWLDRQLGLADQAVKQPSGQSDTAAATTRITEGKVDITSRVETNVTAPGSITLKLPDGSVAGKIPLGATTAPKGQNMPATLGRGRMSDSVTAP